MKEIKDMKEMKAVILGINKGKAIVLDKSGRYHKIPVNCRFEVGCETVLPQQLLLHRFKPAKVVSIAAAFIIAVSSLGAYTYSLPYSFMEVDINPSVQFTANIYNRIIKVESFNEDGRDILTGDSYRNMSLKNGLNHLLEKAEEKGYISEDKENAVLITVSSQSKNRADDIITEADNSMKKERKKDKDAETTQGPDTNTDGDEGKDTDVENFGAGTDVVAEEVPIKLRQKQVEKSVASPGRNALVEKLISENPELDAEELKNASVKELVESIKEIRKQEKEETKKREEEERRKAKESREKAKQEKNERKQQKKEDKQRN